MCLIVEQWCTVTVHQKSKPSTEKRKLIALNYRCFYLQAKPKHKAPAEATSFPFFSGFLCLSLFLPPKGFLLSFPLDKLH